MKATILFQDEVGNITDLFDAEVKINPANESGRQTYLIEFPYWVETEQGSTMEIQLHG